MDQIAKLRTALTGRLPMGFGISGALGTRLFTYQDVDRLIRSAREAGISIFDTGPSYGAGLGERRLGRAIGNDPSAFVMTKAGLVASGLMKREGDFAPASIAASIDQSLKRLKRDRIDLLWLHGPHQIQLTDDLYEMLGRIQQAGKVAAYGVASWDHGIRQHLSAWPFAAFMGPAHRGVTLPVLDDASPLFFGIEVLTGVQAGTSPPRARSRIWKTAKTLLRGPANEAGPISVAEAFAYAYQTAACDFVVSTTTHPERLRENAGHCATFGQALSPRPDLNQRLNISS